MVKNMIFILLRFCIFMYGLKYLHPGGRGGKVELNFVWGQRGKVEYCSAWGQGFDSDYQWPRTKASCQRDVTNFALVVLK